MSTIIAYMPIKEVSAIETQACVDVDSSSATAFTIPAGYKGVQLQNHGDAVAWYGDDDVAPGTNRGAFIVPSEGIFFESVSSAFKIYFKTATGTAKIGIIIWK
jgi:hypothetical protein